ncbi:GTP-binding ADP-ribosylation factor-like protein ARL2 [Trachipleistophora hominis]|uniref:GTP-binding ADP-ribosylation factor-like protein ARL2 n=1 Tax=Trachipleistophora hominis TaxID=72359 RepID=L7JU49_TRAHO|nr:GTP-binding ADP-ribosylation factor-like protein ARL2 [Trachipleistophora hominis]
MSFNLLVKQIKKKSNDLKFIVVGLDNSGKTTIINNILRIDAISSPTFGYTIYKNLYKNTNLTLFDIGGQEALRKYWSNFYEDADGVIFVFDLFDTRDFVGEFNRVRETLADYPVLIYGNKIDLDRERGQSILEKVKNGIDDESVNCYGVSGKMGTGLEEGMDWLIDVAKLNLAKHIL